MIADTCTLCLSACAGHPPCGLHAESVDQKPFLLRVKAKSPENRENLAFDLQRVKEKVPDVKTTEIFISLLAFLLPLRKEKPNLNGTDVKSRLLFQFRVLLLPSGNS